MGSPLRPALAKLIMRYHKEIWLDEFKLCKVTLYRRYVDDIICFLD